MLNRTLELEHLATAQRHVIRCRHLIRQQIKIVRLQQAHRMDMSESLKLLRELRVALSLGRRHIHNIEQDLEQLAEDEGRRLGAPTRLETAAVRTHTQQSRRRQFLSHPK